MKLTAKGWRRATSVIALGAALGATLLTGCGSGNADNFVWGRTPSITPDGKTLIFCQNLSTPSDRLTTTVSVLDAGAIYTAKADGSSAVRLTPKGRGPDFYPVVSPDGMQLAFISAEDRQFDLWLENIDGSGRHKLTFDLAVDTTPTWAPDGRRIAFVSDRGGNSDVWMINTDGSGLQQITSLPSDEGTPSFSHDGTKLVFVSNRDRSNFDVWVMDLAGGGLTQLTRKDNSYSRVTDGAPVFSPDDSQLCFERWDGNWDIYQMNADGSSLTRLTHTADHSGDPVYTPDGLHILFTSSRSGWWQIWQMDRNGANQKQVTGRH